MKKFEEILIVGHAPQPPKQHQPYETPEGALYIGYTTLNKEYLYTEKELEMFEKLKGAYTNLPAGDPYAESPPFKMDIERMGDERDKIVHDGKKYIFGRINDNPNVLKPNFSTFRNFSNIQAAIDTEGAKGAAKRATSVSEIKVLDVISEGEIEGIVSYKYNFSVEKLGQIGYTTAVKEEYQEVALPNGTKVRYLPSIYFNGIPVVDQDGLYNFQQVDVSVSNGKPDGDENGIQQGQFQAVKDISDQPLQVIRKIGERLRGPNRRPGADAFEGKPSYFSKFYKVLNKNCDGVKIFIRLDSIYEQNIAGPRFEPVAAGSGYGDKKPVQIGFGASFRKLFSDQTPESFSQSFDFPIIAKLGSGFIFEFRMPLYKTQQDLEDPLFQGYEIKITRYTPDSISNSVQSRSTIDAIGEIYHQKFTYPNTALISSKFISEYFTQLPERSYDVRLLKVKIPSNYDPVTKTYDGDWDGLFKEEKYWTDNPAWCYYDLLTSARYGLGDHLKEDDIDKWTIYELSKYCDEMVSDGEGGFEPRYVCNVRLSEKSDAFNALKNFSSIFRGFTYYMGGSLLCTFDAKRSVIYSFNNSNVKTGGFSYQGSPSNTRGNVFLVRYNDQDNFFEPAIEYLEDPAGIKRNGIIQKEVNAFGCTKKSYALRYAKWMKETENTEVETVNFMAGIEAMLLRPGDVINISDRNRSSRRLGGRIFELLNSGSEASVTLDSVLPITGNGNYNFTLVTPTFSLETSLVHTGISVTGANNVYVSTGESGGLSSHFISGIRKPHLQTKVFSLSDVFTVTGLDASERTRIIFNSPFEQRSFLISGRNPFFITSDSISDTVPQKLYRIIGIKEESTNEYAVNGLEVNDQKYDAIDSGIAIITERALPNTPTLALRTRLLEDQISKNTIKSIGYQIFPNPVGAINNRSYAVFNKKGDWVSSDFSQNIVNDTPPSTSYLIDSIFPENGFDATAEKFYIPNDNGTYNFRVYARNGRGKFCLIPASGAHVVTEQEKLISLITISSLTPKDDVFFSSAVGIDQSSEDQKLIDIFTGNQPGQKLKIGPNYTQVYGKNGVKELITLEKQPNISWQAGLPIFASDEVYLDRANIFYRITAREPSPTNAPSKFIYFEVTGFSNGVDGSNLSTISTLIPYKLNLSGIVRDSSSTRDPITHLYPEVNNYKFPTPAQLTNATDNSFYLDFSPDIITGKKGPFRNYDVVVEAMDTLGWTSSNYSLYSSEKIGRDLRWDLTQVNTKGFDILEIRNPRPAQTIFTPDFRFVQAKESMIPVDAVSDERRSSYFNAYKAPGTQSSAKMFNLQPDIEDNYSTLKLLGANNNEPTFCVTQQFFEKNGNLTIKIKRDARGFSDPKKMIDYRGVSYALILYSDKWFNSNTIKTGAFNNFTASSVEPGIYLYSKYEEYKPIAKKITSSVINTWVPSDANSEVYNSVVQAKVVDLRDNDQFMDVGALVMDVEIVNSKYVSVGFVDSIDADRDEILEATDKNLALLKRSNFYNFSPTSFFTVTGEPNKRSGFRAYAAIRMRCTTGPLGHTGIQTLGGEYPVGRYPVKKVSHGYLYVPAARVATGRGGSFRWGRLRFADYPASPYPEYYYPHIVQLEIYPHGIKSSVALQIRNENGDIGFHIKFELDEKIPAFNRLLFFGGSARKPVLGDIGKDQDTYVTVAVFIPSLQQPPNYTFHGYTFSPRPATQQTTGNQFRQRYGIVGGGGNTFVFEEPVQSFFALLSNGQNDSEIIETVGTQANGITIKGSSQINPAFFKQNEDLSAL